MIAKPFWDPSEEALYHADPHAGNLFCTDDGELAILDWTLAGRLSKEQRVNLMQIVLGGMFHNEAGICQAVEDLGRTQPDESRLRASVSVAMREVRQGQFPGFNWSQRLLDNIALTNVMGFPENLVLFRKALLTLSSVVADIAENVSMDQIMLTTGLRRFCGETPTRLLANPGSRAFGTHLSNIDLFTLWGSCPNSATAYWLGVWQDCLDSFGSRSS
jgi:ubiquinone biosynthesis protein